MRYPVKLNYLLVAAFAAFAACDANHDGDKGAVWGTDKQTDGGSEVSGVDQVGRTKKNDDEKKSDVNVANSNSTLNSNDIQGDSIVGAADTTRSGKKRATVN